MTIVAGMVMWVKLTAYSASCAGCSGVMADGRVADHRLGVVAMERFCRDEVVPADGLEMTKAHIKEVLMKDGWSYVGPIHNDGINCTVTMWTR